MNARKKKRTARKEAPLVLLSNLDDHVSEMVVEACKDWGWELRSLWITGFEWPTDKPVAGVLSYNQVMEPVEQRIIADKIPAVRLGRQPEPRDRIIPAVLQDLAAQGRLAADHFHDRGFKNIGFIGYNPQNKDAEQHGKPGRIAS